MYADVTTHRITQQGKLPPPAGPIQRAFGNTMPRIIFNDFVFREILIKWILECNISFQQVYIIATKIDVQLINHDIQLPMQALQPVTRYLFKIY